ncbi:uncharacterized protein LOC134696065 [Mytilus trossulus]|uniref:uncharacterized protein LOC134696065 n=1 Tax=Mytilus trossulus TaxID=6551 RepID=UPI0030063D73
MDRSKIKIEQDVWENSFVEQFYNRECPIFTHKHVHENMKDDPNYDEKIKLIEKCQELGRYTYSISKKPPLNIAIIGTPGGGKSSLLNTIFASFSTDCWKEFVIFGSHGRAGNTITTEFTSYKKDSYYKPVGDHRMPTFLDMPGFEDDESKETLALLEMVFTGRIKEQEKMIELKKYALKYGVHALLTKYNKRVCHRPVDRIIVVCTSNLDEPLPKNFLNAVWEAARKHRGIPVYGVLTCRDRYPPDTVEDKIKEFRNLLALPQCRFAHIINYCDAIQVSRGVHRDTIIPSLDVPVLQFLKQVLNPRQEDPTPEEVSKMDILSLFAFIFAVMAFVYVLLTSNN